MSDSGSSPSRVGDWRKMGKEKIEQGGKVCVERSGNSECEE